MLGDMKEVKNSLISGRGSASDAPPLHAPPLSAAPPIHAPPVYAPQFLSPPPQPQAHSYAGAAGALGPQGGQAGTVTQKPVKKISYVGDSIAHNVMFEQLEKITKTKISRRKAYGAIKSADQRFPTANFVDTVPKEMNENSPDVLVLQRDSVTLTDLSPGAPEEYNKQQMKIVSYNMVTAATDALAAHPECQKAIVMHAAPRFDGKEELNMYGNQMLHQAKIESTSVHKNRVMIGVHNLHCDGPVRAARYGDERSRQVDMIHMKGPSGMVAFSRSVAAILAKAGLATTEEAEQFARNQTVKMKKTGDGGYRTQNKRGWSGANHGRGGNRQAHQPSTFQLATQNRYGWLSGDC